MSVQQLNLPSWKLNRWCVRCDFCEAQSKKLGPEAGDAAENAHKEGFKTISVRVELPMKWACPSCSAKKTIGKRSQ